MNIAPENWSEKHIFPAESGQKVFNRKSSVTATGAESIPCTHKGTFFMPKLYNN